MKKYLGELKNNSTIITNLNYSSLLISKGYGIKNKNYLILDIYETLYLLENNRLDLIHRNKPISTEEYIKKQIKNNKFFFNNYLVYKDIKSLGYIIKTGLKFGFDFRVYPLGKKIDEAHTKYVISIVDENKSIKPNFFSKSIRMAQGLNTNLILAMIDNDLNITYYKMNRIKL